jgi:hypothetical protein
MAKQQGKVMQQLAKRYALCGAARRGSTAWWLTAGCCCSSQKTPGSCQGATHQEGNGQLLFECHTRHAAAEGSGMEPDYVAPLAAQVKQGFSDHNAAWLKPKPMQEHQFDFSSDDDDDEQQKPMPQQQKRMGKQQGGAVAGEATSGRLSEYNGL